MKKPISTSTYLFNKLRGGEFIYVDKTEYIYKLIKPETAQIFCARPRRFGKSLMISTLEALFQGKKELFKDLYICNAEKVAYNWKEYPIIHLNLAGCNASSPERLEAWLKNAVHRVARLNKLEIAENYSEIMFENLICDLADAYSSDVIILLDEYDKPLTDNISNPKLKEIHSELESFYGVIKAQEDKLRFTFITGVTKFSQMSIFSKLNNLTDISMDEKYTSMFGYTETELITYFEEYINDALSRNVKDAEGKAFNRDSLLQAIRARYDGFCFFPECQPVYNPVSVGMFFNNNCRFRNYWYDTATPSFLVDLARKRPLYLTDSSNLIISDSGLGTFNLQDFQNPSFSRVQLMELLLQTGYLTFAGWAPSYGTSDLFYKLRFPNDEVSVSFDRLLVRAYTGLDEGDSMVYVQRLISAAFDGNTGMIILLLREFFAGFSYQVDHPGEGHFQTIVHCIFKLCGMKIISEEPTNIGRIDSVLQSGGHIYIIEFKFHKTAKSAVKQIEDMKYAEKYILTAKERGQVIHLLGINFSIEDRNIIDEYVEKIL